MAMYIHDRNAPMRGSFHMVVKNRAGRTVLDYEDHNMIVDNARNALARLVSMGGTANKIIKSFAVGTGLSTPSVADVGLQNPYMNNIVSYDFPENGTVCFHWALDFTEANGMNISEFGLFCSDGTLFARKTREAIHKSDDLSFTGTWSIIF